MRTLLRVEHLTKDFSTHGGETYRAVDDVSFSLGFHEKMAVIGESGSGKTTLARMITRLTEGDKRSDLSGRRKYYAGKRTQFKKYLSENADGLSDAGRFF